LQELREKLSTQENLNAQFQIHMSKTDSTITLLQQMLETKVIRENSLKSNVPIIPEFSFSDKINVPVTESSTLMAATAKVLQDNASVEKSVPLLDGVDEESWRVF